MTTAELQEKLLYAAVVAGKSAVFADGVMARLARHRLPKELPFEMVRRLVRMGTLRGTLMNVRSGNYGRLTACFTALANASKLDLALVEPQALEGFHGIGPKTARFFVMWTRPDAVFAALDVHVLRWLGVQGHRVPKATPQGAEYARLERIFLAEAARRGMKPRELDFEIWQAASGYTGSVQSA